MTGSPICPHKGQPVGSILSGCKACHRQPIFACELHERCCLTRQQAENVAVRACEGCPDFAGEITCPWLKRGCCEAAGRLARIPQGRCKVDSGTCQRCLAENPHPGPRDVTEAMRETARRGAIEYDPVLAGRV